MNTPLPITTNSSDWLNCNANRTSLRLYVQPNSKKTLLVGEFSGALKIKLSAPNVDGKANKALLFWLAKCLALPQSSLTLQSGLKSRYKLVIIDASFSHEQLINLLAAPNI